MLKRILLVLVVILLLIVSVVAAWTWIPVSVDRETTDPAISYANAQNVNSAQYKEAYFEHRGLQLHYVEAGEGEIVLFLHGFPSFWYSHIRQMDAFKADHRVIAIDGLGAGRSDAPQDVDAYRLEPMVKHLIALLDHLGADKVHLVGHDWGSGLAYAFAQSHPHRLHSVTGTGAIPHSVILDLLQTDEEHRKVGAYVERFKSASPFLLLVLRISRQIYSGAYQPLVEAGKLRKEEGELFRTATSDPKRINAHINWYRANLPRPEDIEDGDYYPRRGTRVTVPALFIWGSEDPIVTQAGVERLRSISDQLDTLKVPGAGHLAACERTCEGYGKDSCSHTTKYAY